jgi:hypothetical protein
MSRVQSRARCRTDRAGDPLDGLVNLFDLGIVLAVAFLVAALQSLHLTQQLAHGVTARTNGAGSATSKSVLLKKNQHLVPLQTSGRRVKVSSAGQVGSVYKLPDGSLVYVKSTNKK